MASWFNKHHIDNNLNKFDIVIKSRIKFKGGDDGFLHIWDLRQFPSNTPIGTFKHHTAPITSVEWHWSEPSVLASAGEDNQVALWDLAVERDDEEVVDEELKVKYTYQNIEAKVSCYHVRKI